VSKKVAKQVKEEEKEIKFQPTFNNELETSTRPILKKEKAV